jgi:hypothetical protein
MRITVIAEVLVAFIALYAVWPDWRHKGTLRYTYRIFVSRVFIGNHPYVCSLQGTGGTERWNDVSFWGGEIMPPT